MPGWGDILNELNATLQPGSPPDFDGVRRKYITELFGLTGRNVVIYATDFMGTGGAATAIDLVDMAGLMEVFRDLDSNLGLDLILHSPGGSAEAADRLVRYMRSKFDDVRVFVPVAAMSAATMWALAADRVVMGKHSQLGPIDPQMVMPNGRLVPASALRRQFEQASNECAADPSRLTAWLPTLQQYWPGMLEQCRDAEDLAKELVAEWVEVYMLRSGRGAKTKAAKIAEYFADSDTHKSHGRGITREQARAIGVKVDDLEKHQDLQDAVLSVHHAMSLTLNGGSAVKVVENQLGRAWVQHGAMVQVMGQAPMQIPIPLAVPITPPGG